MQKSPLAFKVGGNAADAQQQKTSLPQQQQKAASSSRLLMQNYQLSDELKWKFVQNIAMKYARDGDVAAIHEAATKIQEAWRRILMHRRWDQKVLNKGTDKSLHQKVSLTKQWQSNQQRKSNDFHVDANKDLHQPIVNGKTIVHHVNLEMENGIKSPSTSLKSNSSMNKLQPMTSLRNQIRSLQKQQEQSPQQEANSLDATTNNSNAAVGSNSTATNEQKHQDQQHQLKQAFLTSSTAAEKRTSLVEAAVSPRLTTRRQMGMIGGTMTMATPPLVPQRSFVSSTQYERVGAAAANNTGVSQVMLRSQQGERQQILSNGRVTPLGHRLPTNQHQTFYGTDRSPLFIDSNDLSIASSVFHPGMLSRDESVDEDDGDASSLKEGVGGERGVGAISYHRSASPSLYGVASPVRIGMSGFSQQQTPLSPVSNLSHGNHIARPRKSSPANLRSHLLTLSSALRDSTAILNFSADDTKSKSSAAALDHRKRQCSDSTMTPIAKNIPITIREQQRDNITPKLSQKGSYDDRQQKQHVDTPTTAAQLSPLSSNKQQQSATVFPATCGPPRSTAGSQSRSIWAMPHPHRAGPPPPISSIRSASRGSSASAERPSSRILFRSPSPVPPLLPYQMSFSPHRTTTSITRSPQKLQQHTIMTMPHPHQHFDQAPRSAEPFDVRSSSPWSSATTATVTGGANNMTGGESGRAAVGVGHHHGSFSPSMSTNFDFSISSIGGGKQQPVYVSSYPVGGQQKFHAQQQPFRHQQLHSPARVVYTSKSLPRSSLGSAITVNSDSCLQKFNSIGSKERLLHIDNMRATWTQQQRSRLYRIAMNFFNKKPDRGIQLLIDWGFVEGHPRSIALLLSDPERRGYSKQKIGEFLGTTKSPFHVAVLEHFMGEISMYDMEVDKALRQLINYFRLPGESDKIDYLLQAFARRYLECNPSRPGVTQDAVYALAFAIVMLNTDLHAEALRKARRMRSDQFIENVRGVSDCRHLDKRMLAGIYDRVRDMELRAGGDHVSQVTKVDQSIVSKEKPKLVEPHRRLICYCRMNVVADPNRRQRSTLHQRDVFLFNDMLLVCKLFNRRKFVGQYTLRYWTPLIGLRIEPFQNALYPCGLILYCPDGHDLIFNAKNPDDRQKFVADVRDSVAECTEMEQWRIEMELDRQQQGSLPPSHYLNNLLLNKQTQQHVYPPGGTKMVLCCGNGSIASGCGVGGGGSSSLNSPSKSIIGEGTRVEVSRNATLISSSTAFASASPQPQRDSGLPDDIVDGGQSPSSNGTTASNHCNSHHYQQHYSSSGIFGVGGGTGSPVIQLLVNADDDQDIGIAVKNDVSCTCPIPPSPSQTASTGGTPTTRASVACGRRVSQNGSTDSGVVVLTTTGCTNTPAATPQRERLPLTPASTTVPSSTAT